jgi:acetyl esterase/lipase
MESKFEISLEPTAEGRRYAAASANQLVDLYLPADMSHQPPLIVAIHGGRFSLGNRRSELLHVPALLAAGWAVASVEYRLSHEAKFPAAVQDCKAAVRWLRASAAEFGYDPERVIAWGRSAGGHLAAMLGATGAMRTRFDDDSLADTSISAEVQAVVDWYGPSDFSLMDSHFAAQPPANCPEPPWQNNAADSPTSVYLGAALPTIPHVVQESNPVTHVRTADTLPPFFLAAGDADCKVPYQQTLVLAEALEAVGADVELRVLPGIGHGAIEFEEQITPLVLDWLEKRHLAPELGSRA